MAALIPVKSIRRGQAAILCQLCETEQKITCKCLECEIMMCHRCREKIHPKFASADEHTILDIKEISKQQIDLNRKPDLKRIKCGIHEGQNCCIFCKTCQELLCQRCIAKFHSKHEFCDIEDEYQTKMAMVKTRKENIQNKAKIIKAREQTLNQMISTGEIKYDQVKQEIVENENELINDIKKHTSKLMDELDDRWDGMRKHVDGEQIQLKEQMEQLQQENREIENLCQPLHAKDVFSVNSTIKIVRTNIKPINLSFPGVPMFVPSDTANISLLKGNLKNVQLAHYIKLTVEQKFETQLKEIHSVVCCPGEFFWISDTHSEKLQKVKAIDNHLEVITEFNKISTVGTAVFVSGDLLLQTLESSTLRLVRLNSQNMTNSVFTVSTKLPRSVHVTRDNKVIVGAVSWTDNRAQVIKMDESGKLEEVFEYDNNNKPLFTLPYSLCANSIGTIAVLDVLILKDMVARVVIIQNGNIANIYNGRHDDSNGDRLLRAFNMTTTPSDNFVIADFYNHQLHVLDNNGHMITYINTKDIGITFPGCLSFNDKGELFIGQGHECNSNIFLVRNFIL